MSRTYDFTLAASVNATQRIDVMGSRVKVISATYAVTVRTENGDTYRLLPGQGFSLPEGQTFREILISNTQAFANTGEVFIGDRYFEDSRITGEVNVIDSNATKTDAGMQFIGSQGRAAAAGLGGIAGLRAGVRPVAIKGITVFSSIAGTFQLFYGTGNPTTGLVTGAIANKKSGEANALATAVSGTCVAANPVAGDLPGAAVIVGYSLVANASYEVPLTTPIVLAPGHVLVASSNALNRDIFVAFDIEEL